MLNEPWLNQIVMPSPDPVPLPGPPWLLRFFLVLGWFLHALPLAAILGGALIALVTEILARLRPEDQFYSKLARQIGGILPVAMGITITFGIVPLLFLQVLYGQAFFASSVLMAWPWLSIPMVLILAYYGFYLNALARDWLGRLRPWIILKSFLVLVWVALIFTSNATLMSKPSIWLAIERGDYAGWFINLSEPSALPRLAHLFSVALELSGLMLCLYAWYLIRWREAETGYAHRVAVYGLRWAVGAAASQAITIPLFLVRMETRVTHLFLGGDPVLTGLMATAILLSIMAFGFETWGLYSRNPIRWGLVSLGLCTLVIGITAFNREAIRRAYLSQFLNVDALPSTFQAGPFLIFLTGFVLAIAGIGYVLWISFSPVRQPRPAAGGGMVVEKYRPEPVPPRPEAKIPLGNKRKGGG